MDIFVVCRLEHSLRRKNLFYSGRATATNDLGKPQWFLVTLKSMSFTSASKSHQKPLSEWMRPALLGNNFEMEKPAHPSPRAAAPTCFWSGAVGRWLSGVAG
jgi:hypothetical protein